MADWSDALRYARRAASVFAGNEEFSDWIIRQGSRDANFQTTAVRGSGTVAYRLRRGLLAVAHHRSGRSIKQAVRSLIGERQILQKRPL